MKYKKYLFLITTLFLITGCSATYNLTIDDKGYNEELIITATNKGENNSLISYPQVVFNDQEGADDIGSLTQKIEGIEYYNDEEEINNGLKKIKYDYLFKNSSNYLRSNIINNNFDLIAIDKYKYDEKTEYTYISTSDKFNYIENMPELENITINVTNKFKVISTNADEVNGNLYTWYITKDNQKAINMVYDTSVLDIKKSLLEKLLDNTIFRYFAIVIPISLIIFIIYKILKKYSDKKNEI